MCETEKHLKKKGKRAGLFRLSAVAAALGMSLGIGGGAEAANLWVNKDTSDTDLIKSGDVDYSGDNYGVLVADGKTLQLTGNDIKISGNQYGVYMWSYDQDKEIAKTKESIAILGSENTKNISITVTGNSNTSDGLAGINIYHDLNSSNSYDQNLEYLAPKVTLKGETLTIDVENNDSTVGQAKGVWAASRTTPSYNGLNTYATVNIESANTIINVKSAAGNGSALVTMSEGRIYANNGNVTLNADNIITTRGESVIEINKDNADRIIKLNGDIDFNYYKGNSGTNVDSDVVINLNGAESVWNGNSKVTWGVTDGNPLPTAEQLEVTEAKGVKLGLSNGATWNPDKIDNMGLNENGQAVEASGTKYAAISGLKIDGGIININDSTQTVEVMSLSGTGGTINIAAEADNTKETGVQTAKLTVRKIAEDSSPHLNTYFTRVTADNFANTKALAQAAQEAVVVGEEDSETGTIAQTAAVGEGIEKGVMTVEIDENGQITAQTEAKNTGTAALQKIGAMNFLTFRAQMNDVSKRMGDLRTMPQNDGMWARAIAGQSEYKNIHNTYQTLQVGGDKRIGNFYIGGTASYTDGDGKLNNGSTDDKNWSFGLYGGWIADNGQYVDIIVKRHKFQSDYDISYLSGATGSGSMDTWGTSASVEYGWRLGIANTNYYIEPQAELMIGHLNGISFDNRTSAGNIRVKQEGIDTRVGRLGVAAGWVSPEKTGSAYLKASVLHDWEGDAKIRTGRTSYKEEMGGTWGEFALGGTWNINKSLAAYGEVETTAGNPVRTTYQISGGIRYSF